MALEVVSFLFFADLKWLYACLLVIFLFLVSHFVFVFISYFCEMKSKVIWSNLFLLKKNDNCLIIIFSSVDCCFKILKIYLHIVFIQNIHNDYMIMLFNLTFINYLSNLKYFFLKISSFYLCFSNFKNRKEEAA